MPNHETMNAMRMGSVAKGFALGVLATVGAVCVHAAFMAEGLGPIRTVSARSPASLDREAFHAALDEVLDRYVEPVDEARLLSRGLKSIVAELDPHSHYLTAEERKRLRPRGGTTGLAVLLAITPGPGHGTSDRSAEIVSVLPGSAAARAGLEAGDHLLAVGERSVASFESQAELDAALVGAIGREVGVRVQRRRQPEPETLALALGSTAARTVEGELVTTQAGKIAVVRIRRFSPGSGEAVQRVLADLRRSAGPHGLAGIVLDVRHNPGGEVDEALVVADLFVAEGVLTRTRGRGGRILREERAHAAGTDLETRLVVLQDRHSASAAELLAAALHDHGRATIVGERSYGKGTVQKVIGLDDGSVLALTIARYFSPSDRVIDGVGVPPDVSVSFEDDTQAVTQALGVLRKEGPRGPSPVPATP